MLSRFTRETKHRIGMALGHPSLLGLQIKGQKIEQLLYCFLFKPTNQEKTMSSAVNGFVHAIHKHSKSARCNKWHILVPLHGSLPMIQPPFNRSWVVL